MESNNSVQRFYDEVFEDFKNRLFIAYRFKSTISSEQIDKFSKIVKDKMHRKRQNFHAGIKYSLEKKSLDNRNQQHNPTNSKVKIEHEDEQYEQMKEVAIRQKQNQQQQNSEESSEQDDLNAFMKPEKQPEVKQQEKAQKQEPKQENSEQLYEEQDRQKQEVLAKSAKKISAHIIATYNTRNKKHIPKDQKTKIDLQNVFIRTVDRQAFYTKIQCDFQQAQYMNIKL